MARMKTEFKLEWSSGLIVPDVSIQIVGQAPENKPYVAVNAFPTPMFIPDCDLERFAVNILKALNSPKLKK